VLVSLLVYVPFLQKFFDTAAFPAWQWLFLFAWTPSLLITDEIRKVFDRRRMRRRQVGSGATVA